LPLAVHGPAPVTRSPGSAPGTCVTDPCSPRSPPFTPPAPPPAVRPCSQASSLVWQSLTSRARASSATAPRPPDADPPGTAAGQTRDLPVPVQGASVHARVCDRAGPGGARAHAPVRVAFRLPTGVGTRGCKTFAAQWLACTLPYRRFANTLAGGCARLGASVDRYSFTAGDFHPLLLAGLPAHSGFFASGAREMWLGVALCSGKAGRGGGHPPRWSIANRENQSINRADHPHTQDLTAVTDTDR
jgi:hypothetical protein